MNLTHLSELPDWRGAKRVCIDIETRDPHLKKLGPSVRRGGYITGIAFAIDRTGRGMSTCEAHYLPVRHDTGVNYPDPWQVFEYLRDQGARFRGEIVGANLQYDLDYLAEEGVTFEPSYFRDVQISGPLLLQPQLERKTMYRDGKPQPFWAEKFQFMNLDAIAKRAGLPGKDEAALIAWAAEHKLDPKADMWKAPASVVAEYAMQDARLPLQIINRHHAQIHEESLWDVYDLECELLPVLLQMRRVGVRVDLGKVDEIADIALERQREAAKVIAQRSGKAFDPKDINKAAVLEKHLAADGIVCERTPTGLPSVKAGWLASLTSPVALAIQECRKWDKVRGTFCESIRKYEVNGRIHCTFNQLRQEREDGTTKGVGFGRLSSDGPNLQQQPARDKEIGPLWRSIYLPDEGGEWACLDFSCYDEKTEILTPDGWISFPQLKDGQPVAQWDDGDVTYVVPSKVHRHDYDGHMVRVRGGRQVDLLLTPNHDCVLRRKNGSTFKLRADEWSERPSDAVCPQNGLMQANDFDDFDTIRLAVAIQADASRRANSYRFFLSREDKIQRLEHLLRNKIYSRGFSPAKGNQTSFEVEDGWDIDTYLGPFKTFRRKALLQLSPECRRAFLDELLHWDGNKKSKTYLTTNKENADVVQEVAVLTGYRSNIFTRHVEGKKTLYRVSLNPKEGTIVKSIDARLERYSGRVYCVTVPSGAVIVRRNGRVAISGNSQEPRWITHFAEAVALDDPARTKWGADVRAAAAAAAEACRSDPGWDNHSMMAEMIYGDEFRAADLGLVDESGDPTPAAKHAKRLRGDAKTIFLGLCYGMGGGKLCAQLGLPTEPREFTKKNGQTIRYLGPGAEGQELLDRFDAGVPYVRALARICRSIATTRGQIRTVLGRPCRFPCPPGSTVPEWTHKALNRLIQGSSADQTKRAMVLAHKAGIRMQLQVHDEIDLTIWDRKEAEDLAEIMRNAVTGNVPFLVDIEVGPNWGAIK